MSVVEELRQNDPARTKFYIRLHGETSDAALAQALEQNPFVTEIGLSLDRERRVDWNSLLRVIATRANLETVELRDALLVPARAPSALVRSILHAIQQNTAIQNVEFWWLRLSTTDISTFVDNASSITSFRLNECDGEQGESSSDLAAALQRNRNIQSLEFSSIQSLEFSRLNDIYTIPILEGLRSNVSLKTFIFTPANSATEVSDATSQALQHLLESTTSIQIFELVRASFSERQFPLIAQAITSSECVSKLKFLRCRFEHQSSIAQLRSILQNKRNLTSLCLDGCVFDEGQIYGDIISILSRPDSVLRCFELYHGNLEPNIQFKNLLRAIERSKLERFQIGCIETTHQLQILTQSIPLMKLKELEIEFWNYEGSDDEDEDDEEGEFSRETIRQDLLHAVQNNFSLRSLKAELSYGEHLFDNDDKQTLAFYANRNESLDQWVDNPETVKQQKVWPEALSLAERAGPDAFFRGLRSVLQSDHGSLPGGRKRKRPQFYTPS